MAYKKNEKTLAADIPTGVFRDFEKQRFQRGQIKKQAITAALNLWISLPEDIQARIINKSLDSNALVELVEQILDQRIEAGQDAGKALAERLNKKPLQKD